jgi:integrase
MQRANRSSSSTRHPTVNAPKAEPKRRISEALDLAWKDVDLDRGSVLVHRGATDADDVGMSLDER